MLTYLLLKRLPNICAIGSVIVLQIKLKHTHSSQTERKTAKRKKKYIFHNSSFLSVLNSPFLNKNTYSLLCMGFNNNVEGIIYSLQEHLLEGNTPRQKILHMVVNSLCEAQNKEGIVLASLLAREHFSFYYKSMCHFEVFQPVHWNPCTLDRSISHYELLYTKLFPMFVGKSLRSSLISSYLHNGLKMEFLDLYYFVTDVFYYWRDVQPLTAFWEVLFSSPRKEDQAHAHNLLEVHKNEILTGMKSCLLSLIFTLANLRDSDTLSRLANLIEDKTLNCREAQRLYSSLKQLIIEMKYNEGRLDESIILIASSYPQLRDTGPRKRVILNQEHVTHSKIWNPKNYFIHLMSVEEAMMIPISPLLRPK